MSLLVPERYERENLVARLELDHARHVEEFNRMLHEIDPAWDLVYVHRPPGEECDPPAGMVWNRWHIRRTIPERRVPDFHPITGPDGEFMEPHSGVLEQLKEGDLWTPGVRERFRQRRLDAAIQRERAAEASRAEIREETRERLRSLFDTSISFGGRGWTASAAGRRGRA